MKQVILLLVAASLVSGVLLFFGTPQVASFTSPLPTLPPPPIAVTYPPCPSQCVHGCIWYVRPLQCYWPPTEEEDKDNMIASPAATAMPMPTATRAPFYSRRDTLMRY